MVKMASIEIDCMRRRTQEELSTPSHNDDINFIVESVKALIVTNDEIWERCQQEGVCNVTKHGHIIAGRYCHHEAIAHKKVRGMKLEIKTQMKLERKEFGPLPAIPSALAKIIAMDTSSQSAPHTAGELPDYVGFCNKATLLVDGVLLGFLNIMKNHLEDVQVFLGRIEEWLLETHFIVEFLNSLCKQNLKAGGAAKEEKSQKTSSYRPCESITIEGCCSGSSSDSECSSSSDDSSSSSSSDDSSSSSSSDDSVLPRKKRRCKECGEAALFKPVIIFSTNRVSEKNAIHFSFDLGTKDGRERLKSFLNFAKMY